MENKEEKVVPLGEPLEYQGEKITELRMWRPKGKLLRKHKPAEGDGSIGLILGIVAGMNGLPADALDDLDGADVMEVVAEFSPFLEKRTGARQSA